LIILKQSGQKIRLGAGWINTSLLGTMNKMPIPSTEASKPNKKPIVIWSIPLKSKN